MDDKHYQHIYAKVYGSIIIPSDIPLDYTKSEYRREITRSVLSLVSKGIDPEDAFRKTTGYTMKHGRKVRAKTVGKHRKKASGKKRTGFAIATLCLLAAGGGTFLGSSLTTNHYAPEKISALASEENSMSSVDSFEEDTNILFVGVDSRPEVDDGYGVSSDIPGKRADIIALVKLSKDTDDISVVSIPRDTAVDTTPCVDSEDGYSQIYGSIEKINSVNMTYGDQCLTKTVEHMTGEKINAYAEVDFEGFMEFIDSIGGVEVETDGAIVDDTLGVIVDSAGKHTLDGRKALDYARARKVEGTTKSDLDRIKRQQEILSAVVKAANSGGAFDKLDTVRNIITNITPHMATDGIDTKDMLSLAKRASNTSPDEVKATTIPIVGDDPYGNLVYDQVGTLKLFGNEPDTEDAVTAQDNMYQNQGTFTQDEYVNNGYAYDEYGNAIPQSPAY